MIETTIAAPLPHVELAQLRREVNILREQLNVEIKCRKRLEMKVKNLECKGAKGYAKGKGSLDSNVGSMNQVRDLI